MEEWLEQFYSGDQGTFRLLVHSLSPYLLNVVSGIVRDPDIASDVMQDSWLLVYNNRKQFKGNGHIRAWVATIFRHRALGHLRSQKKNVPYEQVLLDHNLADPGICDIAVSSLDFESSKTVNSAVLSLPYRQREAIIRYFYLGQPIKAIADAMGCRKGTIKATLSSAKRQLRERLRDLEMN